MENKKNNKKFIIIICCVIVAIAIIVGIVLSTKNLSSTVDENNSNQDVSTKNETKNTDDFEDLEKDIEEAINQKNLITASSYYTVLKMGVENGGNSNKERYNKITNDLQLLKDERKQELLTKVDSNYDDMTLQTKYNVKGAKTEFDEDVHLMPVLVYDGKNKIAIFGTQFGIVQDSWIFFDSLIINVDGDITNIEKSNIDKYTNTLGGGYIFEYCSTSIYKYPLFNALVEKIIKGNEVKVRFVGKAERGSVDHNITAEEKENLAILYELSLCL